MKLIRLLAFAACILPLSAEEAALPIISLLPNDLAPIRGQCEFKEIVWKEEGGPYLKGTAPVCKFVYRPIDVSKFPELAKEYGMKPQWTDHMEKEYGTKEEGAFLYWGKNKKGRTTAVVGSPKSRRLSINLDNMRLVDYDKEQHPIVKPLIPKEAAVEVCREWMRKLGIDENDLYRQGKGPAGFEVKIRIEVLKQGNPEIIYPYGYTLQFSQQIGGLCAHWRGTGGSLYFEIDDDGKLCGMDGRPSAWEKIADYPILSKDEILEAIREQFYWRDDQPFQCDKVEVVHVGLRPYHGRHNEYQPDFPLVYFVAIRLVGGPQDGEITDFMIPALKQQRHSYGPYVPPAPLVPGLPEPLEREK